MIFHLPFRNVSKIELNNCFLRFSSKKLIKAQVYQQVQNKKFFKAKIRHGPLINPPTRYEQHVVKRPHCWNTFEQFSHTIKVAWILIMWLFSLFSFLHALIHFWRVNIASLWLFCTWLPREFEFYVTNIIGVKCLIKYIFFFMNSDFFLIVEFFSTCLTLRCDF